MCTFVQDNNKEIEMKRKRKHFQKQENQPPLAHSHSRLSFCRGDVCVVPCRRLHKIGHIRVPCSVPACFGLFASQALSSLSICHRFPFSHPFAPSLSTLTTHNQHSHPPSAPPHSHTNIHTGTKYAAIVVLLPPCTTTTPPSLPSWGATSEACGGWSSRIRQNLPDPSLCRECIHPSP